MKRFLFGAGAALMVALLSAFTLATLTVQTARVRWDSYWNSATPPARGANFGGTFCGSSDVAMGVSFGPAKWRMGGIACTSKTAGATDGGTNNLTVRVVHEDGGEDCACSLGSTSCTATTEVSCDCPNGITQLAGNCWDVQIAGDAGCITIPGSIECSVDLFR